MENQNPAKQPEESLILERALEEAEQIVATLQDRQTPLEESFLLYKKGMELLQQCSAQIDLIEKEVQVLGEDGEVTTL